MQRQTHAIVGGKAGELPTAWCVVEYAVIDQTGSTPPTSMMILATRLRDVFTLAECNRNSEWRKCITPEHVITVTIHWTGNRTDCQRKATAMIMERPTRPRCNIYGYNSYSLARPLLCSNDQEYPTQAEACRVLGLNQSQLSRHLKGELRSVKGYMFKYKD